MSIVHPKFTCETRRANGGNGTTTQPIIARCTAVTAESTDDCGNILFGEVDKAERCYNTTLDALSDPFTAEDLVKALDILIISLESGKSDIPPVRLAAIQKGATFIKKLPQGVALEVGGHTNHVGQPASNQTLSDARASAVKSALVRYSVSDSTLRTHGYGQAKPITSNDTVDGKYRNRRIVGSADTKMISHRVEPLGVLLKKKCTTQQRESHCSEIFHLSKLFARSLGRTVIHEHEYQSLAEYLTSS